MITIGLRNAYVSTLLAMGNDIWVIAKNMGHKAIQKITETYQPLIKENAIHEDNKIKNIFHHLNE